MKWLIQGGHTPCYIRRDEAEGIHGRDGRTFNVKWIASATQRRLLCDTQETTNVDQVDPSDFGRWHIWS